MRIQRVRNEKILDLDFVSFQAIVFLLEGNEDDVLNKIPILLNIEKDSKIFKEAMSSSDVVF